MFDIFRVNSIKGLEAFADNANAYNRMLLNHLSISEAYRPPVFSPDEFPWEEIIEQQSSYPDVSLNATEGSHSLMFSIGDSSDEFGEQSSGDENDNGTHMWMGLSPPGTSALARRRTHTLSSSGDSFDLDKENHSPHKIPSAMF